MPVPVSVTGWANTGAAHAASATGEVVPEVATVTSSLFDGLGGGAAAVPAPTPAPIANNTQPAALQAAAPAPEEVRALRATISLVRSRIKRSRANAPRARCAFRPRGTQRLTWGVISAVPATAPERARGVGCTESRVSVHHIDRVLRLTCGFAARAAALRCATPAALLLSVK